MSVFLFLLAVMFLIVEGWLIAGFFVRDRWLRWSLALPLSALANVLLFFIFTVASIPLSSLWLVVGHMVIVGIAITAKRFSFLVPHSERATSQPVTSNEMPQNNRMLLKFCCIAILMSAFFYSFCHAVLLPTFQYDSATNWIMRSKISFLEERIVFDNDPPHEAIKKPHYPFLLHAWHLMGNLGQQKWSDRAANSITFLFTWSMLWSVGLLLARLRGRTAGLLSVTLLFCIPLFAVHLGEGYADHLVALFGALALLTFAQYRSSREFRWLLLSGIFAASAVWTKDEGLFFVFFPWLAMLGAGWLIDRVPTFADAWRTAVTAAVLGFPWPIFAWLSGFGLTPHGQSDTQFRWHAQGLLYAFSALYQSGSFGILWYVLPAALLVILLRALRRATSADRTQLITLLFGALTFGIVLAIYTLTPNVEYLLNAEAFDRQMLTPSVLLVLACFLVLWSCSHSHVEKGEEGGGVRSDRILL